MKTNRLSGIPIGDHGHNRSSKEKQSVLQNHALWICNLAREYSKENFELHMWRHLWWVRSASLQWGSGGRAPSRVQQHSPWSGAKPPKADSIL